MKIVFLDFDDIRNPLLGAGQAIITAEVGRLLARKGHQVTVLSSRYPGYRDRNEDGVCYRHIGLGSSNIRLNNAAYILSIPFHVKQTEADIFVECFTAPISTMLTPLWTRTPVVGLPASFEAGRFSSKYHLPLWLVEKLGARLYKHFLAYSPYTDQKMKSLNPGINSVVVPLGVAPEYLAVQKKPAKHILFIGRLDIHQKGIDLLLRAYARIAGDISYPLMLAGNGPDEAEIRRLVQSLGLEGRVIMSGPRYGQQKMEAMSEALFAVVPSRGETFCLVALEELAAGFPVVCFDIPGLSWTDTPSVVKVAPEDIDAYAWALLSTARSKDIGAMSRQAKDFARNYTWDKVADQYERFFLAILGREETPYPVAA